MNTKENEPESIKLKLILGKKEPNSQDERLVKEGEAFEQIRETQYLSGSFEEAQQQKLAMIASSLFVEDAENSAEAVQIAKSAIIRCLKEAQAIFDLTEETRTKLHQLSNWIGVNLVVNEFVDISEYPDKPRENVRESINEVIRHILEDRKPSLITLEELSGQLNEKGVDITHIDLLRIFIYDINRLNMYPRILCVPNEDFPDNPYILLLDNSEELPLQITRLLRVFDR